MKSINKKIILLVAMVITTLNGFAGGVSVPATIVENFQAMYPNMKDVAWVKKFGHYEADFVLNNKNMSIVFDRKGNLVNSKTEIDMSEAPASVAASINKDYLDQGFKLLYLMKRTEKGVVIYETEIIKGRTQLVTKYDPNGVAVKRYVVEKTDSVDYSGSEGGF